MTAFGCASFAYHYLMLRMRRHVTLLPLLLRMLPHRECAKVAAKDLSTLKDILLQLGLGEELVGVFLKVFHENRKRILRLKGALGLSEYSYKDLSWRLDVEVSEV